MRLSDQLSSAIRYGIMKEAWSGFYSGVITYGGYLLEMDIIRKHGNIFIAVLSMTLVANTAGAIISQWSAFDDGLFASMFIMNVNDSELDKKRSESFKTDRTARNANENSVLSSSKAASIVENSSTAQSDCSDQHRNVRFFMSGTNKVLKNNRHDRLLLALGIFLAILHGLELPAYNILMGRVFAAMREPRHDMIHRLFVTMVMFTCVGFIILVVKTVSVREFCFIVLSETLSFLLPSFLRGRFN
ncbi:unnamed protein product [Anisakis simplex]|uniref:Uncharacterized protein n=1 Tax=Anisakis simplex TaxID=6269 RepID=A0A3P6TPJ5_ANISI|nr:unnamed protein product [Anisakis simplex]